MIFLTLFIKEMVSWFTHTHTHRHRYFFQKHLKNTEPKFWINFAFILKDEGRRLSIYKWCWWQPCNLQFKILYLIEWTWTSLTVGIRLRLSPYTDHHCSSVCKVGVMQTCAPRGRREGDRALRHSEWMRLWMREMVTGSCPSLRMTSPGLWVWTYSRVTSSPTKQRGNFPEGHASNSPLTFKHL